MLHIGIFVVLMLFGVYNVIPWCAVINKKTKYGCSNLTNVQ